jgi:hypothetical protein
MTQVETIQLFPTDNDQYEQYGRDFFHTELGLGRIQLRSGRNPVAVVNFLDMPNDIFTKPYFKGSNVELIDAVTDDATAIQMIEETVLAEEMLE